MSDALLNQASTAELRAVVGHEIGHYVLHHALLEEPDAEALRFCGTMLAKQ